MFPKCGNVHIGSFRIMAIFYFINSIVAAKTIEGGNYSRKETIHLNTVFEIHALASPVAAWPTLQK